MFDVWKLKDTCRNKLSEKDGNSILGYCKLKTCFFQLSLRKMFLKFDFHVPPKNCFICFNECHLKLMKNTFYFILKVLFVVAIFKFLSWLFCHVEKAASLER